MHSNRSQDHVGPRYLAIADAIAEDIATGDLAPGTRLPPQRELAYRLGVTVGTIGRAYGVLMRRQLITSHVGRGTFVRRPDAATVMINDGQTSGFLDLSRNAPAAGPQAEALRRALQVLSTSEEAGILAEYAQTAGHETHRRAGAMWMTNVGIDAAAQQIIVCGGAQQALAMAFAAGGKRSPVLAERSTYPGLHSVARLLDRTLLPVDLDSEGMTPAALDRAAAESDAGMLVVVPTLQNPTNAIMSPERRRQIVDVARDRDLIIVEDDVYGYVIGERPPPIVTLAPERTLYIASVSKCLAPGLRLAWILAPETLRSTLLDALYAMDVCRPPITAEIVRQWIESRTADELLAWQRDEMAARHALAVEMLPNFEFHAHPASFHILLELPPTWTADAFAAAARERGIGVVPARAFNVAAGNAPNAVRISLSNAPTRAALQQGLAELRNLAMEAPERMQRII